MFKNRLRPREVSQAKPLRNGAVGYTTEILMPQKENPI